MSALFKRGDLPEPMPPEEVVEAMGGAFIVKGLLLSERLQMAVSENLDKGRRVPEMLARCVLYDDHTAAFTANQWEALGARHYDDTMRLFDAVVRLSGLGDPEKNG